LVDPVHIYSHTGVFSVKLVVTDNAGATAEASTSMTVELSSYQVTWTESNETFEISNTTQENSTTSFNHTIDQENLYNVSAKTLYAIQQHLIAQDAYQQVKLSPERAYHQPVNNKFHLKGKH